MQSASAAPFLPRTRQEVESVLHHIITAVPAQLTLAALEAARLRAEQCDETTAMLRRVVEAHRATLTSMSAQCKQLRDVNLKMAAEVERQRQLCKAYEQDALLGIRRLRKSDEAHREARERYVREDEQATAALCGLRKTLSARQASLRGSIAKQQAVVQCEERKLAKLLQRADRLRAEVANLHQDVDRADAEAERLRRRLAEGEATAAAAARRLEFQRLQIEELARDLADARARAGSMRAEVCQQILATVA